MRVRPYCGRGAQRAGLSKTIQRWKHPKVQPNPASLWTFGVEPSSSQLHPATKPLSTAAALPPPPHEP